MLSSIAARARHDQSLAGHSHRLAVLEYTACEGFVSSNHKPVRMLCDVSLPPAPLRLEPYDKPRMPKLVLTRVAAHALPTLTVKWHGGIGGAKPDAYLKVVCFLLIGC